MAGEEKSEKSGKSLGKLMGLIFVLVNVVVTGGGAYLVYSSTLGYKPPSVSEQDLDKEMEAFRKSLRGEPVMYRMETFNTNLDGVPQRMIRIDMNLEMLDEEGFEEIINAGAQGRDSIIRILNSKTFDELETIQGKLLLKNQIIARLNAFMDKGVVKNVYFTDFVVQ